ncbi:MAG: peptidylprolyl isomerase [Anaerolineales bacterium]|nr:peptidylprolyl isomerase [Anaerolineales bacterium]MCB8954114.1 peptidylprolyl isomerase [Ardenticatenales bacterium]
MSNDALMVDDGMVVRMDYTLRLDDGNEIDSSAPQGPLEFLQGIGQIVPGLESALYGMRVGDEKKVVVEPIDGYGELNADEFQLVSRDAFPTGMDLQVGMRLQMRDTDSGATFDATVDEVRADSVVLDFNHPLAGETLFFDVKIVGLRAASPEEMAHGHVH